MNLSVHQSLKWCHQPHPLVWSWSLDTQTGVRPRLESDAFCGVTECQAGCHHTADIQEAAGVTAVLHRLREASALKYRDWKTIVRRRKEALDVSRSLVFGGSFLRQFLHKVTQTPQSTNKSKERCHCPSKNTSLWHYWVKINVIDEQ